MAGSLCLPQRLTDSVSWDHFGNAHFFVIVTMNLVEFTEGRVYLLVRLHCVVSEIDDDNLDEYEENQKLR